MKFRKMRLNAASVIVYVAIFWLQNSTVQGQVAKIDKAKTDKERLKAGAEMQDRTQEPPELIPQKSNGKFGYVNREGKFVIPPSFQIAMFFGEDCNLLFSLNEKLKKFGAKNYATVDKGGVSYRIDKNGKTVYTYKPADLGVCKADYKKAKYFAYRLNGKYGLIEDGKFFSPSEKSQFTIYPTYDYLFVMESEDPSNPMIIVSVDNLFGIVDIYNREVIPLVYKDIKRNYSWKLGHMFEVTQDDVNYFYIDIHNKAYRSK